VKKINILLTSLFFVSILNAQNPLVKQWDYRYGGDTTEWMITLDTSADKGYILGGFSYSDSSGDKTEPSWGTADYWIVKTDSLGIKQWDKRFGGTDDDQLYSVQQTGDGGFISGGYSSSGVTGDKSQPSWGYTDYWILKIDSMGNKLWDKRFGGTSFDDFYSLDQTHDGGYILGGESWSDSSGDKTQPSWGSDDFWIVKTDSLGNKQWDRRYGGTGNDILFSLRQTHDNGYILGGWSGSGIGGDKSQPSWGGYDYWILKTDSLGNKEWDKRYGGLNDDRFYSLEQTNDKGYILAGTSNSGIGGDKTQASWGGWDIWVLKIDSLGNKQWDKRFGGTDNEDILDNIFQTPDRGYLISGDSYSDVSGDKSENNLGFEQSWIIKTDSSGNKQWDKTIFTSGHDEGGYTVKTALNCYTIANSSNGSIGGYKTQSSRGRYDYWMVKFCDTTSASGINNVDLNACLISFHPNPFSSKVLISIQKQNIKQAVFTIKNILGQTVFSKQKNNSTLAFTTTIDLSFLSKGIYLLDVIADGERTVKKIVKE
jgi:type IX secretion system substrate protein